MLSNHLLIIIQLHGKGHFESVTWVYNNVTSGGNLYSGVQSTGLVYVHQLNFEHKKAALIDHFVLPPPNPGDLAGSLLSFDVCCLCYSHHV